MTCPNDETVPINKSGRGRVRFHAARPAPCAPDAPHRPKAGPSRSANTTNFSPKPEPTGATAATPTTTANTAPWSNDPSPGSSATGHRRVRYRGVTANRIGLAHRAAAVNLQRLTKLGADHNGHTWQLNAA